MRKNLLTLFALLAYCITNAQVVVDTTGVLGDSYNKWSVDVYFGQAKGLKPYEEGYYSSNPGKLFGGLQANTFGASARYMLSPKFGLRLDLNYDKFTEQEGSGSLPFETSQYTTSLRSKTQNT